MLKRLLPAIAIAVLALQFAGAAEPVDIAFDRVPLVDALDQIQKASGIRLAYSQELVADAKPVTLKAENEPVDEVLHRILRPRGLEFIYTGEDVAAIVPAGSDMGMAKMAGRAIRTFVRLAKKLEAAEQHGDEVKVPGWTDADDRALAEGLVDFFSAMYYFDVERPKYRQDAKSAAGMVERMLAAYDADVRAGVVLPFEARAVRRYGLSDRDVEQIKEGVTRLTRDDDPIIRGCGLYVLACMKDLLGRDWERLVTNAFAQGKRDPAPEVRFAAAAVCSFERPTESMRSGLEELRSDASAAVRLFASRAVLLEKKRSASPAALRKMTVGLLTDKNPVAGSLGAYLRKVAVGLLTDKNPAARSLGLYFLCATFERDLAKMQEALKTLDVGKDPWLKVLADAFLPLMERGRAPSLDPWIKLTTSDKRSHQALGLGAASLVFRAIESSRRAARASEAADEWEAPDLTPFTKLSDATYLPARFVGIVMNGMMAGEDAEARILRAVKSDDEIDRIAGLFACSVRRDPQGKPKALSPELRKAVQAAFRAPSFAEYARAAIAIGRDLPFDDLLAFLREEAIRNPESVSTNLLLKVVCARWDVGTGSKEGTRRTRQMMLWDALHESKDASLQIFFFMKGRLWLAGNPPLVLCMIYDLEPRAFVAFVSTWYWIEYPRSEELLRAILHRVGQMYGSPDPAARALAVEVIAKFMTWRPYWRFYGPEIRKNNPYIMLGACVREGATGEEIAAGLQLLERIVGNWGPMACNEVKWPDMPRSAQEATVRALGYANDETYGPRVAAILGYLFAMHELAGLANDPELERAMAEAHRKIMEGGRPEEQIVVLCGEARSRDEAIGRAAVAELEKRLMKGAVPIGLQQEVLLSFQGHRLLDSHRFKEYLMKRLSDPEDPARLRRIAFYLLGRSPDQMSMLIETLTEVAKAERPAFDFGSPLNSFVHKEILTRRRKGQPNPPWVQKAAELGLMVAKSPEPSDYERACGLSVYAAAFGEKAAETIEAFVQDDEADVKLRAAAAWALPEARPDTKLYGLLAAKYDTLPRKLIKAIAESAARSPMVPDAEAFVIRFLKDADNHKDCLRLFMGFEAQQDAHMHCFSVFSAFGLFELPLPPKLRACLEDLRNDPRLGRHIDSEIRRFEREQE